MRHLALFFVLGAVLFFAKRAIESNTPERPHLVVTVPAAASVSDVERAIDQALLTDLALSGPAVRNDPVVREQLVRSMGGVRAGEGEPVLIERALSLGVHRVDPVVRERLAFQGEQMLRSRLLLPEPSDRELTAYLTEHEARYREPARASFMHVFLSRARRGESLEADAAALLSRLQRENARPAHPGPLSDPTILPLVLELASAREIDARLGAGVGDRVLRSPLDAWSGPVVSAYGLHLVLVRELLPVGMPLLRDVRARVRGDYLHDQKREALTRELLRLRQRYTIEVKRGDA